MKKSTKLKSFINRASEDLINELCSEDKLMYFSKDSFGAGMAADLHFLISTARVHKEIFYFEPDDQSIYVYFGPEIELY